MLLKPLRHAILLAALIIVIPGLAAAATAATPPALTGAALATAIFLVLWGPLCEVLAIVYPDPKVNSVIQAIDKIVKAFAPKRS